MRGDPRDRDRGTDIPPAALFRRVGHSLADEPSRIHDLAAEYQTKKALDFTRGHLKSQSAAWSHPTEAQLAGDEAALLSAAGDPDS